jgi:Zn-dependent peptidase ImmA (M78 family)
VRRSANVAGRRSIIVNRKWKFSSENERRSVLADELGHALLGPRLVESTEPGKPAIGLLEPRRHFYEREARAFAAELLMPFAEVRRRWFGLSRDGVSVEDMVRWLADEFAVTTNAMRVRLQQMKVVRA